MEGIPSLEPASITSAGMEYGYLHQRDGNDIPPAMGIFAFADGEMLWIPLPRSEQFFRVD